MHGERVMPSPIDILRRLWWDRSIDFSLARITFVHRGAPGDVATIEGYDVEDFDRSFIVLKTGASIPSHRICRIEHGEAVLFSRE